MHVKSKKKILIRSDVNYLLNWKKKFLYVVAHICWLIELKKYISRCDVNDWLNWEQKILICSGSHMLIDWIKKKIISRCDVNDLLNWKNIFLYVVAHIFWLIDLTKKFLYVVAHNCGVNDLSRHSCMSSLTLPRVAHQQLTYKNFILLAHIKLTYNVAHRNLHIRKKVL
jgi:hypothetical protein